MANAAIVDVATLEELVTRLHRFDRDGAFAVIDRAMAAGATVDAVVEALLAPAQVDVGLRWVAGEIGAIGAHGATAIVQAALVRAAPAAVPPGRPFVAVGCPEGEAHELAADMVTELLRARGWPAQSIGAGVPATELRDYLARQQPAALLLSCSTPCGLAGAAGAIIEAHRRGVPVIVGGAGFGPSDSWALRIGATAWAPTVADAAVILDDWQACPPELAPVPAPPVGYLAFQSVESEVRALMVERLRRAAPRGLAESSPRPDSPELLLTHLGAALLVDEPRLLLDYLTKRLAFLSARGLPAQLLADAVEIVEAAVPETQEQIREFLDHASRHVRTRGVARFVPGPSRIVVAAPVTLARTGPMLAAPEVSQGQVFADLLFLASMACRAPITLISVPQADGQWSTLSHGVDRRDGLADARLFAAVAGSGEPLDIRDLADHDPLGHGPLATGPLAIRFLYGTALRSPQGTLAGVFCVLDRTPRDIGRREQQAVQVIARQVTSQLLHWRRGTGPVPVATTLNTSGRPRRRDHVRVNETLAELVGLRGTGVATEPQLLRSHEVAVLFDVTERTVINWAASGKLASLRTAGGHLRFRSKDVMALLDNRAGSATG